MHTQEFCTLNASAARSVFRGVRQNLIRSENSGLSSLLPPSSPSSFFEFEKAQYSLGKSKLVTERSDSITTQNCFVGLRPVTAQEPKSVLQAVLVLPAIFRGNIFPLSAHMQREEFGGRLSCLLQRSQRAGRCNQFAQGKQWSSFDCVFPSRRTAQAGVSISRKGVSRALYNNVPFWY